MQHAAWVGMLISGLALSFGACTKDSASGDKAAKEPVAATAAPAANPGATPAAPGKQVAAPLANDNCKVLDKLPSEPPVVLAGKNVVLTRILKPCVTRDGKRGYEKNTPYLAMGFPCTGGTGRIERKGHHAASPQMVTFFLGTDCGMAPSTKEAVQQMISDSFGMPKESQLAAYTPFVVQFWEIQGMSDADVGYAIEMRSAPAVEGLWHKFQQSQPIRVHLYGRENTWAQGDNFYFVEADLTQAGNNSFRLQVVQVKPLSKEEVAKVKARCELLRPKRNCTEVF